MGKVLFFNIPATGHINPSLNVVRELVQRGEEVIYVNAEETRALIESSGATFVPYPAGKEAPEIEEVFQTIKGGHLSDHALALHKMAGACLSFCLDLIDRENPDLILHDSLAAWGHYAGQLRGIKTVGSITTFVLNPELHVPMGLRSTVNTALQTVPTLPEFLRWKRALKEKHGVEIGGPFSSMISPSESNLVFTLRELQPNAERLGPGYHFIGASIGKRPDTSNFPFDDLSGQALIYVSLGTINHENIEFYHQCFEALGDLPYQVILAVGKKTDLRALGQAPENFIVRQSVPQLDILERCELFITHAGMNSVHESLWFGVPMLAIPQQMEQAIVARQVERVGAGLALATDPPIGNVTSKELCKAVESVLAERKEFQTVARELGDALRRAGGAARGAELILGA